MEKPKPRSASYTPMFTISATQEPLIVVEESQNETEKSESKKSSPCDDSDLESPVNPYLLSPWRDPRDTRKHSLPALPSTSEITASQVRRLSEGGAENLGISSTEQAFLATLSQTSGTQPGGRRHSVVTISKVPTMFGRNRRESIGTCAIIGDRRGSQHNLELDIMDGIAQIRKGRAKSYFRKPSDAGEAGPSSLAQRRYSDFAVKTLPPIH